MSSVTHHRCAAARCRWLGSVPIHRREDTDVRRLFPAASDTGTVEHARDIGVLKDVYSARRLLARMITTAKLATRTAHFLLSRHPERRIRPRLQWDEEQGK